MQKQVTVRGIKFFVEYTQEVQGKPFAPVDLAYPDEPAEYEVTAAMYKGRDIDLDLVYHIIDEFEIMDEIVMAVDTGVQEDLEELKVCKVEYLKEAYEKTIGRYWREN